MMKSEKQIRGSNKHAGITSSRHKRNNNKQSSHCHCSQCFQLLHGTEEGKSQGQMDIEIREGRGAKDAKNK